MFFHLAGRNGPSNPFGWFFPQPCNTFFTHMHCWCYVDYSRGIFCRCQDLFSCAALSSPGFCWMTSSCLDYYFYLTTHILCLCSPFLWQWTGSSFKTVIWNNCGVYNICFSGFTVLCCHSPMS